MSHKNLLHRLYYFKDPVILENKIQEKTHRKLEGKQGHNTDQRRKHDLYSKKTLPNPIHKPTWQSTLLPQTHILLLTKSKPQHPTSSTHWNQVKQHKTQKC